MCESSCQCDCTKSITMDCSLPSPVLMSCSTDNCNKDSLCCNVHVIAPVMSCNLTSLTSTTHKSEGLIEFTVTSTKLPIMPFLQTSSFTQSTSSTYSTPGVKSNKSPLITPHFTKLSSIDSTTSLPINNISTHNYKLQCKVPISSTTVDAATTIPQSTVNITLSTFDSIQSTFNIVQSIIDTNQRNTDTNTLTIITISVTIVVLSIILILIIIVAIFSLVIIVKRYHKFNPGK